MRPLEELDPIFGEVSKELGIGKEVVKDAYCAMWKFIKTTIENSILKDNPIAEYKNNAISFNIYKLGKLHTTKEIVERIVKNYNDTKKDKV